MGFGMENDEITKPAYNDWMRNLRERMAREQERELEEQLWRSAFDAP